jgi:hypothetical protein
MTASFQIRCRTDVIGGQQTFGKQWPFKNSDAVETAPLSSSTSTLHYLLLRDAI